MSDEFEDSNVELNTKIDEAKHILVENFPSNEARSCMIQLTENLLNK